MTEEKQNLILSREPIELDIHRLANEAHTHAYQKFFVAVLNANRGLFPAEGVILMHTRHPFERSTPPRKTEQEGKKKFVTSIAVADFFADLEDTSLFLYWSDNDVVDLFWTRQDERMHLMMAFDNPYFVMKD